MSQKLIQPIDHISTQQKPKLYLLTDETPLVDLLEKLALALSTGAIKVVQIRRKQHHRNTNALCHDIESIMTIAQNFKIPVIINDNVDLAYKFGTGVHLGADDTDVVKARNKLGTQAIIGKTCYNSLKYVDKAITNSADYVAMGALFRSTTKPSAKLVDIEKIKQGSLLCKQRSSELCVIGGITATNINLFKSIPIDYIAVTADILNQPVHNIIKQCQKWQHVLTSWYDT